MYYFIPKCSEASAIQKSMITTTASNVSDIKLAIQFSICRKFSTSLLYFAKFELGRSPQKNVHLWETLFEKLIDFNIEYSKDQDFFKNLDRSDFESFLRTILSYKADRKNNLDREA